MEKFDYHFIVRNSQDVAINLAAIYNGVAYVQFDKTQLKNIFKTSQQDVAKNNYLQYFSQVVKDLNTYHSEQLDESIDYLNQRWQEFREHYYNIIEQVFNIQLDSNIVNNLYCKLQFLPINEICVEDGSIYLNCNQSNDQMFIKFIIMLTKLILLHSWSIYNNWKINSDFDTDNKIFIFADIAIDAIFNNSDLKQICESPSYKYFYNLNYQNSNMMKQFRQMYKNMEVNKFLDEVYLFVYNNYQSLIQFRHYLY